MFKAESRVTSSEPTVPTSPSKLESRLGSSRRARWVELLLETTPSPSLSFETNPSLNEPTSGSMSHNVLRSFPVRPDRASESGSNRCTETPPYMKFLNCASKASQSSASSGFSVAKNGNGSLPRDDDVDPLDDGDTLSANVERS